jgi:hypothetical protein
MWIAFHAWIFIPAVKYARSDPEIGDWSGIAVSSSFQRKVDTVMKRCPHYLLVFLFLVFLFSCGQDKTEESEIVCRINEYKLPVEDFQRQLAEEVEMEETFKLTQEAKEEFLEGLIRKELLIQEAKELKLDRRRKFVKAIERYWEATLIRDLMDMKCEEIRKKICISEEEIETRYKEMNKRHDGLPNLSEMHDQIREELREEKEAGMLEEWIRGLKDKANIEINEDYL